MSEEVVEAGTARVGGAKSEPAAKDSTRSNLHSALGVLALAVGFAVIPHVTKSCESVSLDEDAPDWDAKIVANGWSLPGAENPSPNNHGAETTPERVKLSELRGHPIVLDFWATWCGPCQMEAPIVNTIAQRYKDRGLAVIGVNTSDEDGLAASFIKKKQLGFPVVYDAGNTIANKYGVKSLPTLVVISKTGKVVAIRTGVTSAESLDEIVRRYL